MKKIYRLIIISLFLGSCSGSGEVSSSISEPPVEPQFIFPKVNNPIVLNENEISFGLYPKSVVTNADTIRAIEASSLKKDNYFAVYEKYYYKNENGKEYVSKNGASINAGIQYYELEPITWRILNKDGNNYFLIAEEILDSHRFNELYLGERNGIYASNYEHSEIREWLNGEFKTIAFADSAILKQTVVDNSLASTMKETNPYICENTLDYVYLPSVKDLTNPSYGFKEYGDGYSNDANRTTSITDFATSRQKCELVSKDYEYHGKSPYWTRTPYEKQLNLGPTKGDYTGSTVLSCISDVGRLDITSAVDDNEFCYSLCGVRPCISITYDFGEFPHHVNLPEETVSYTPGSISSDDLASIIRKAVDIEKKYLTKVSIDTSDFLLIERFNDGYYHYNVKYPGPHGLDVYAYSTSDFSHNYYCMTQDGGETYSDISDSVVSDTDDQYSALFGYGQIGINPAAFLACQSGLIYYSFDFDTFNRVCKKTVESYIVTFSCRQLGGSVYFAFEAYINKYGGIDYLRMGNGTTTDVEIIPESGGYKSSFGSRVDAPQFLVDMFGAYHD